MTMPARVAVVLGRWSAPPDDVAWVAFAVGAALVLGALAKRDLLENVWRMSRTRFLASTGLLAAFLTLGYAAHYLRGGPRIIDATAYALQAKALAHGHFSWPAPFPSASFRGRFLLFHDHRLAGIFPPGFPLLLSIGYALGAPMLVGIALAASLAIATYMLALELDQSPHRESSARLAAILSLICAALRYHSADPMSHAATALAITIALTCALRASRNGASRRAFIVTGLAIGFVVCARPVSSIPIFFVTGVMLRRASLKHLAAYALAIVPGILLLAIDQHAVTGSFFASTQRAYYAVSDGPPNCFRYGFGENIGCLHEHGDFVRSRLAHGYGALAAFGTTIRRLHLHLSDALDGWPVFLLALPACISGARRDRSLRIVWLLVVMQIVAYAPFYFDGDYPGGGARLFADILPLEHAAIAVSIVSWSTTARFPAWQKSTIMIGLVAIAFGLHGAHDAIALAERDYGRPMFEPERLQDAKVDAGLLFIDTDHGFDLAADPMITDPKHGLVVARLHNDGHDRLLFDELGHPPTWAYRFGNGEPTLQPFTPGAETAGRETWRFEAEAEWPPLAQNGAWAEPIWATGSRQNCPSNGQALAINPSPSGTVTIALPIPRSAGWSIRPTVLARTGDGPIELHLRQNAVDLRWSSPSQETEHPTCIELGAQTVELQKGEATLEIAVSSAPIALDRVELYPTRDH